MEEDNPPDCRSSRYATGAFVVDNPTRQALRALVRATKLLAVSIFLVPVAHAGLERYQDLVVADGNLHSGLPKQGVRVTYLGTNAYLLESRTATLLVDPYFSRMSLLRAALNLRALPKRDLIERYLPVRRSLPS